MGYGILQLLSCFSELTSFDTIIPIDFDQFINSKFRMKPLHKLFFQLNLCFIRICTFKCFVPFLNTLWHTGHVFDLIFVFDFPTLVVFSILASWTEKRMFFHNVGNKTSQFEFGKIWCDFDTYSLLYFQFSWTWLVLFLEFLHPGELLNSVLLCFQARVIRFRSDYTWIFLNIFRGIFCHDDFSLSSGKILSDTLNNML